MHPIALDMLKDTLIQAELYEYLSSDECKEIMRFLRIKTSKLMGDLN